MSVDSFIRNFFVADAENIFRKESMYIVHNHLFTEYDNHGFLQKQSKKLLLQNVVAYLFDQHVFIASKIWRNIWSSAVIELFPVYKTHSSLVGGIVSA